MHAVSETSLPNGFGWIPRASRSELFRILHFLDSGLPSTCPIHSFVHAAIASRSSCYIVFYYKDTNTGLYTAIIGIKKEKECWLIVIWDGSDPEVLNRLWDMDHLIDWKNDAIRTFGYHNVKDKICLKYLQQRSIELIEDDGSPLSQYYLPVNEASMLELNIPTEIYVKSLEPQHALAVHQACPYKSSTALEDIIEEIRHFPTAGVFLKANDQLVSWIMYHPPAGMSRLYTLESYRRKGYASLAASYLSRIEAQCGRLPFVSIIKGNTPAVILFANLGFRLLGHRDVYIIPGSTIRCDAEM